MSSVAYAPSPLTAAPGRALPRESSLFSQAGLAIFLVGVASGIPIQTVGRLFLGEIGLIAISPIVAILLLGLTDQYGRTARTILGFMILSWVGYLLSDLVRGTPTNDYLRGWSRWVAMGASFATLAWLGSKNIRYLAYFLIGLSVGGCLTPIAMGGLPGPKVYWKFYAGVPVIIIAVAAVSRFRPWASIATLVGLAVVSIALDTRSHALAAITTAGITFLAALRTANARGAVVRVSKTSMLAGAAAIAAVMLLGVYLILTLGARYGYGERFQKSNSTRMASATVAWSAVKESPFIGYGSWPRDRELARQRDKLVAKAKGTHAFRTANQDDLIIAHSQILQGWLEGGILGLAFFALLAWQLGRYLMWIALASPYFSLLPLMTFVLLECAWNLFFSPFSGAQRIYIPASCVIICYLAEKNREAQWLQRHTRSWAQLADYRGALQPTA